MKIQRAPPTDAIFHGASPRPEMRGKYFIRNRWAQACVRAVDLALSLHRLRTTKTVPSAPVRILVANWAHFGDLVMTLPAIAALREAYPDAEFGLLIGSSSQDVVTDTGLADHLYCLDHPLLNRANATRWEKIEKYMKMRRRVVGALKLKQYDIGIDFYHHFPPASPIFFAAGIPLRVGYDSGGFGPLLTHPISWKADERPVIEHSAELLSVLGSDPAFRKLRPLYPGHPKYSGRALTGHDRYVVVHTGAGGRHKEWPEENWTAVIEYFLALGLPVVLTGAGEHEKQRAKRLQRLSPKGISLSLDQGWSQFVSVVAEAAYIVAVDSAVVHIAASFERPTTVIWSGTNNVYQWGPMNPNAQVLMGPVDCSPCYSLGCAEMHCIKKITAARVVNAITDGLRVGAVD